MSVEAMKQALEWIEAQPEPRMIGSLKVITALNQAIEQAEQAQAVAVAQTHCPEKRKPGGCQLHNLHCGWPKCNEPPKQKQAQPVAWVSENVIPLRGQRDNHTAILTPFKCAANTVPLYTAPPPRQPEQAELQATERQVEILSDALAESRKINAELLEALRGMIQLDEENHQRYQGDEDICKEVQDAYAAIAKATGDQS